MPRKQRFKPSRKKPPATDATVNENKPVDPVQLISEQPTERMETGGES